MPTLNINVYNQSSTYLNSPIVSTSSSLTSLSMATIFTNASLESNMSLCHDEPKESKDKGFDDVVFE